MSQFTVTGRFENRDGDATFEMPIDAETEGAAREHVRSRFGSHRGLERTQVDLEEVVEA